MTAFRFPRLSLCALVVTWLGAAPILAQDISGTISGSVADEQGQVLPGATVTAVNERTSASRSVTADDKGNFQFTAMPPSTYTVRVQMPNFRTVERKRNVLSPSDRLALGTIKLTVGLGESIVVEASGARVNTEETQHSA